MHFPRFPNRLLMAELKQMLADCQMDDRCGAEHSGEKVDVPYPLLAGMRACGKGELGDKVTHDA